MFATKQISFPHAAQEATTVSLPWAQHLQRRQNRDSPLWNVVSPPCDGNAVLPRGAGVILERIDSIQKTFLLHQLLQALCEKKTHHLSNAILGSEREPGRQEQNDRNIHKRGHRGKQSGPPKRAGPLKPERLIQSKKGSHLCFKLWGIGRFQLAGFRRLSQLRGGYTAGTSRDCVKINLVASQFFLNNSTHFSSPQNWGGNG